MFFRRVLVSAGGTREPWDEVRYLGNRSSGRQGCEIARAALDLGAEVTLVAANVEAGLYPQGVKLEEVETAEEMLETMLSSQVGSDLIVQCAAVADFRPKKVSGKISRHSGAVPTIKLERTPDVLLNLLSRREKNQLIVGFGALNGSVEDVLVQGAQKARDKAADILAVNRVGNGFGFGSTENTLYFFDRDGRLVSNASGSKYEVGKTLLQLASNFFQV